MGRSLWDLVRREDGVVAVIFAVMAIPFIAMAGWAVDYVRLQHVQEKLQSEADAAALNALIEGVEWADVRDSAAAEILRNYNGTWAREIEVTGGWLNDDDFEVVAEADVPLAFMRILPGVGETQHVTASAVARISVPIPLYSPPEFTSLDFEAWDFNRLWLYCFWPDRPLNDPTRPRRTQMVPIADNGGSVFTPDPGDPRVEDSPIQDSTLRSMYETRTMLGPEQLDTQEQGIWRQISGGSGTSRRYTYLMPQCPSGSELSIRLENVREALEGVRRGWHTAARWDSGGTRYNHYTDTVATDGAADDYTGLGSVTILETVICDTLTECENDTNSGGLIPPTQRNRTPEQADVGCNPGSFMYYGWEDRPPEGGGSDRDYDDIRIVMACADEILSGERNARLLR